MKLREFRPIYIKGAILCALLLVGEFIFPNYASRISARLIQDAVALMRGEASQQDVALPEDQARSNEFNFQFVAVEGTSTRRPAGVFGPDENGRFTVVDQLATEIAGREITVLLETLNAWYPEEEYGGIKQLIEVDGSLFGLMGLARDECLFGALVDLTRMELVEEFPCLGPDPSPSSLNGLGGGYVILDDTSLLLALGTGGGFTWSPPNARAQDPDSPYGKVLRYDIVHEADGPHLINRRISTMGHRNPQGMVRLNEMVLAVEHGPMGGDEINLIEDGANYGWPMYSAGSQYNEGDLTSFAPDGEGYSNPLFTFVPSVATSDISTCPSLIAARYDTSDCVIVAGLASEAIFIVLGDFANQRVRSVERINVGVRVREVFVHAGSLYLLPDSAALIRVEITARSCTDTTAPCGREQ